MDALSTPDLTKAERELYSHFLCYVKSMALKCAVDLGIPEAIYQRGGATTLHEIVTGVGVHPSKLPQLRRLMNVLSFSGMFVRTPIVSATDTGNGAGEDAVVYELTPTSRLLVTGDDKAGLSLLLQYLAGPTIVSSFFSMKTWFKGEHGDTTTFFELTHGCDLWENNRKDGDDNNKLNVAMVADSRLVMEIFLKEAGANVLRGVSTLVDVGGGHGQASKAIAAAFPHVKCTVMDLPHVVSHAPTDDKVEFIAGDMFKHIPPADAVLLKVLRRCKEAISAKGPVGKVIIIDVVMGSEQRDMVTKETQGLYDLYMIFINGIERDENQWRKIFVATRSSPS
ncbi:hypothetical protein E2562_039043 [Oryza meyeriana var. granulata]|uniref:O-methyltransferase domain-containing protein n=1 Tax=Oryza meyeriana var. granulata TaxID=110450 RepID=A0A6G1CCP4_9ORYZ|nr:hypothetical protein E2562_039043 [Oryza meyeriana var. granulata]